MISALIVFLKAFPELLTLLRPLVDAYQEHGKEVVHQEIRDSFERLKNASSQADKDKALDQIDGLYRRPR